MNGTATVIATQIPLIQTEDAPPDDAIPADAPPPTALKKVSEN